MNQTYLVHKVYEWEASYAYSSRVGGFLHLQVGIISLPSHPWGVGIISLPISRREIDGYKVPSTYTNLFCASALCQEVNSHFKVIHLVYIPQNVGPNESYIIVL
jgi:hypothetical protein